MPETLIYFLILCGAGALLFSLFTINRLQRSSPDEGQLATAIPILVLLLLLLPPLRRLLRLDLPVELLVAALFCFTSVLLLQVGIRSRRWDRRFEEISKQSRKQAEQLALVRKNLEERDSDLDREAAECCRMNKILRREQSKFEAVLAAFGDSLTVMDTSFRILFQNAPHKEKQGDHLGEYCYQAFHQREAICDHCQLARCFVDGQVHRRETTAETAKGTLYLEVSASPYRDEEGRIIGGVELVRDITERKELELQLRHAQKMEAVGSLAGGIAHDFNNLLTTILGYGELALFKLPKEDPIRDNFEAILGAGRRAAALTQQLLAFSRKQVLKIASVDLNQVLNETGTMLARLIDENITLHIRTETPVGNIKADQGQVEQIILNLAINARDAMPQGGDLIIETGETVLDRAYARRHRDLEPGPYVVLQVTDTGEGMDQEVQEKIFEPFFTTKQQGKGTGLGLATVFGIVKQHRGHIHVYSELERGTTFKIYFPRTDEAVKPEEVVENNALPHGTETILVAEDEPSIRELITATLEPLGYTLLLAANGAEALELVKNNGGGIDLLLTDVIMKGMNGRELAEAIIRERPETRVIYMSGYTDNAISHQGVLDPGTILLNKPLTPSFLARKLREILDLKAIG